jgi:hypothetical protein
MATLSKVFAALTPDAVFVARSCVCPCPACWGLDASAGHYKTVRDLRPVFTVQFLGEGGGYLSAVDESFESAELALAAAATLGVRVEGIR